MDNPKRQRTTTTEHSLDNFTARSTMTIASNDCSGTPTPSAQASNSTSPPNSASPPKLPFSDAGTTHNLDIWNYESTVQAIEQIIDRIETGELELADIFDQFAIAVEQLHQCESFLNYHRQQVDLLIETLSDEAGSS